jgi:hypothetical protein
MFKITYTLIFTLFMAMELNAGVINGDFSSTGVTLDPFTDWTTDLSLFERPTDGGGLAQFDSIEFADPSLPIQSIQLAQSFALGSGSKYLSFEFNISAVTSSGSLIGPVRDNFQATLFDSSAIPVELFPFSPPLFTAFYSIDNDGLTELFDANFVTSFDLGGGLRRITLDISTLNPQTVVLDFLLNGNGDGFDTRVQLDNVSVSNFGTIPEPSSLLIWAVITGCCLVFRCWRSVHHEQLF